MQTGVGVKQETIWPESNDVSWMMVSYSEDNTFGLPTDRIFYESRALQGVCRLCSHDRPHTDP